MRLTGPTTAVLGLALALAACNKSEPTPSATEVVATDAATVPALPADAGIAAGTYDVTSSDGKTSKLTVSPDSAYRMVSGNELPEAGVIKVTDGKSCFDPSGDANPPRCYTTASGADGSVIATGDGGSSMTLRTAAAQ